MDSRNPYAYDSPAAHSATSVQSTTAFRDENDASWLPRRNDASTSRTYQHTRGQSTGVDVYRMGSIPSGGQPMSHDPDDALLSLYTSTSRPKRGFFSGRSIKNIGCIAVVVLLIICGAVAYPIYNFVKNRNSAKEATTAAGAISASGPPPKMPGRFTLIDPDTPQSALTQISYYDGQKLQLVFSDEFENDGRSFYPGDDPFWQAEDLHYWQTGDQEWYDPDAVTTAGGALRITLSRESQTPDPNVNHGLTLKGGMLNTWNKLCFTGGYIEASVKLPGSNNIAGLWPAVWTFGNLGRAGYGATTHGMWPYTYDSCDVGTLANQTLNNEPVAAFRGGAKNSRISSLPGQRLSRCTCAGEDHPGPKHPDGSFVGRSSPEIDLIESQHRDLPGGGKAGTASQSAQWAPYDVGYHFNHTDGFYKIVDPIISVENSYSGGPQQQATSIVTDNNQQCYQNSPNSCFAKYGYEYKPGFAKDNAYIIWVNDGKEVWSIKAEALGADPTMEIKARPVPQEPMYIIANLGQSSNFVADIDYKNLVYPAIMEIDYIRIYQPADAINIGCNPPDFPTTAYINKHIDAYTDVNYTVWKDTPGQNAYGQPFPKNRLIDRCT